MNQKSKQQNWTTASQVFNNKNIANFICIPYDYRSEYKRSQKRILTSHMAIFQKWAPFALEGQNDNFWTFFVCKHIPPRNLNMKFKFKNGFNWRCHRQLCLYLTTCAFRAPSFTCELQWWSNVGDGVIHEHVGCTCQLAVSNSRYPSKERVSVSFLPIHQLWTHHRLSPGCMRRSLSLK